MPLRLKWYKAATIERKSIELLLTRLVKDDYSEGKRWGFSNIVLRGSAIEGEYIERFEAVTKVEDPFGNILEFPIVQYEKFFFSVGTKFPNLETHGAPRSLSSFFNQLASYLNFRISIEPVNIDLRNWISLIERNVDSALVGGLLVSNVTLSNAVDAKIALSGTSDVRPFVKMLTGKHSCVFSKVQIVGIFHSQPFKCELFADGRATILGGIESEIAKMLRNTLREAIRTHA
jgi:hypothetical protein